MGGPATEPEFDPRFDPRYQRGWSGRSEDDSAPGEPGPSVEATSAPPATAPDGSPEGSRPDPSDGPDTTGPDPAGRDTTGPDTTGPDTTGPDTTGRPDAADPEPAGTAPTTADPTSRNDRPHVPDGHAARIMRAAVGGAWAVALLAVVFGAGLVWWRLTRGDTYYATRDAGDIMVETLALSVAPSLLAAGLAGVVVLTVADGLRRAFPGAGGGRPAPGSRP
ncbi:hypothetical protein [Agromyces binzhouensis]|uniref:hypothetical protein n=1 Tax=Agromyces binzhouensis TaxID=1817495 RepID=UPI003638BD0C